MINNTARHLRQNHTDAELLLWWALRDRRLEGFKFRRQHPIPPYIADFACKKHKLIIEADGSQHLDNAADERRTAFLTAEGWRVLRFWNNDILTNTEGVIIAVLAALESP
jgi:primosomal protein N' (replication factor Y)